MSVVSFEFLGFLAALAVVYYVLPMRVRKWALLAGSAAFWLLCGWQGAAYLTAETLLIWGCARLIGRFSEPGAFAAHCLSAEWSRFSAQWC